MNEGQSDPMKAATPGRSEPDGLLRLWDVRRIRQQLAP
jgi:hypothetical protein